MCKYIHTYTTIVPAVAEIADRTAFKILEVGSLRESGSVYGVESCAVVF